ncbi:MAG: hypothetical protein SGPRY_004218, partial [Prymnesium sp.]
VNWLHGAKGAGYKARKRFEEFILSTELTLCFTKSEWGPSLILHTSSRRLVRFALHGDDGCGGWATSPGLIEELKSMLESLYGKMKFGRWGRQLGFDAVRDLSASTTEVTAVKYMKAMKKFVEVTSAPAMFQNGGIHLGSSYDALPAINMCARFAHRPSADAKKALKHIIFYLLHTVDQGLRFGRDSNTSHADLEWQTPLEHDFEMSTSAQPLAYHVYCDGALRHDGRSVTGVLHMFGAAQSLPIRGILTELGVRQAYPTPIGVDSRSTLLVARSQAALKKSLYIMLCKQALYAVLRICPASAIDLGRVLALSFYKTPYA